MPFNRGDVVRMRQPAGEALDIGGVRLKGNTIDRVPVVAANADGTYQVDLRAIANTWGMESVRVPAHWLERP